MVSLSDEPGGRKIIVLVQHLHAGSMKDDAGAMQACEGMIRWIRFNLGVKDGGDA